MTEIGKLTDISPRDAWQHEAHDFTPWLSGTICPVCGLIQGEESEHCVYCDAKLNSIGSYC
jgi:hypothetical protein